MKSVVWKSTNEELMRRPLALTPRERENVPPLYSCMINPTMYGFFFFWLSLPWRRCFMKLMNYYHYYYLSCTFSYLFFLLLSLDVPSFAILCNVGLMNLQQGIKVIFFPLYTWFLSFVFSFPFIEACLVQRGILSWMIFFDNHLLAIHL